MSFDLALLPIISKLSALEADRSSEAVYVAKQALDLTDMLKDGTLSAAECAGLLKGLTWDKNITTAGMTQETLSLLSEVMSQFAECVAVAAFCSTIRSIPQ